MGLTNWQLFFLDLQNAVTDQPLSDNEVLNVVRQTSDTQASSENSSSSSAAGENRIGFALVGYSELVLGDLDQTSDSQASSDNASAVTAAPETRVGSALVSYTEISA